MKKRRLAAIMLIGVLMLSGCRKAPQETVPVVAEPEVISETVSLFALGDNLLHMPVVNSGKKEDGSYAYGHLFEKLQPAITSADLAIIGQETVFGGSDLGYSGYPLFNSPSDMGVSLINEGFNVVLHASNHVLDKGARGLRNTLNFWAQYPEIRVLGINNTPEEQQAVEIVHVKGAAIALLNYTYDTNGITLPAEEAYMVNYIDREKIEADSRYAETHADFTVAFMHWGTEYATKPNEMQKTLAKDMCGWGVDLIIGAHPHVIEPMEWITHENGNKLLVYYSLGNFVSRQKEARNLLGGAAKVNLYYDGETVSIADYAFIPIVTHYNSTSTQFSVYPLAEYSNELAALHGVGAYDGAVSVERWRNMVNGVFEGYDMTYVE